MESEKALVMNNERKVNKRDLVLRVLALVLTLTAAIVLGVNKQTKIVAINLLPGLPAVNVPVTAKWHYLSAFTFQVVSDAIACTYAAISLLLIMAAKGGKRSLALMIIGFDLVMVALLFSATGGVGAIGVVGVKGNSHVEWKKVCNVFEKFCGQVAAAASLSLFAAISFLLLVLFGAMNIHKKPY